MKTKKTEFWLLALFLSHVALVTIGVIIVCNHRRTRAETPPKPEPVVQDWQEQPTDRESSDETLDRLAQQKEVDAAIERVRDLIEVFEEDYIQYQDAIARAITVETREDFYHRLDAEAAYATLQSSQLKLFSAYHNLSRTSKLEFHSRYKTPDIGVFEEKMNTIATRFSF